jgi:hypothetical protein
MDNKEKDTASAGSKRAAPAGEGEGEKTAVVVDEHNEFELDPEKRREARKMRRVMANRKSAKESRERRKKLLTNLQDSVTTLTSDNTGLTKENLSLRRELATLIKQSGGASALSMIPNIQALLESAQVFSNLPNLSDPTSSVTVGGDSGSKKK